MDIEEFMEYIKEHILEVFAMMEGEGFSADDYVVSLGEVVRNNDVHLHGIVIGEKSKGIFPKISLNSFYEEYRDGVPTSLIMQKIWIQYRLLKERNIPSSQDLTNIEEIKDKIILRLVNYERNRERLAECPHMKFLDLVVTYHYITEIAPGEFVSALITYDEMESWEMTQEEMHELAVKNTERIFPANVKSLAKVVADAYMEKIPDGCDLKEEFEAYIQYLEEKPKYDMRILSNDRGINGANCILYKDQLSKLAKELDANLFVLPSSVHELILVAEDEDIEPEFLKELVRDANLSAVGLIDLLSDNIYYYDRDKDEVSIYEQAAVA